MFPLLKLPYSPHDEVEEPVLADLHEFFQDGRPYSFFLVPARVDVFSRAPQDHWVNADGLTC